MNAQLMLGLGGPPNRAALGRDAGRSGHAPGCSAMNVKPSDFSVCASCTVTAFDGTLFANVLELRFHGAVTAMLMHATATQF